MKYYKKVKLTQMNWKLCHVRGARCDGRFIYVPFYATEEAEPVLDAPVLEEKK